MNPCSKPFSAFLEIFKLIETRAALDERRAVREVPQRCGETRQQVLPEVVDEVVHGVPTDYTLRTGDVVSFDLVITYKDMKTDSAFTMVVGEQPKGAIKHLISLTERSLYAGIDAIKGPVYTGDIAAAIEEVLAKGKLGIIRELVGHGVGLKMHMPPDIPNYGHKGTGVLLKPGDTIAIEPMATLGGEGIVELDDNWTIATRDGSLAAHFEHTVLITEDGAEILTQA